MWVSSCTVYLCPGPLAGRGGSAVSKSHIFSQGVLAVVSRVGCGAGDGEAGAGTRCESGLLLCSVANTPLTGARSGPKVLEQKP